MATPTSLPASFVDNTTLPAASLNNLLGAFRVLQVFSVQGNTIQTTTSTTYGDITGLSVTITPQSISNKILLISSNALLASGAGADTGIRFLRGATTIYTAVQGVFAANTGASVSTIYLDSPSTTSATTYKVQVNRFAGTGTVYSNVNSSFFSSFLVAEISA